MLVKDSRVMINDTDITEHVVGPVDVTVASTNSMKDRALLYLDRRIRALAEEAANHEAMANSGVSYAERRRILAQTEQRNLDHQNELEALQWLRDQTVEKL